MVPTEDSPLAAAKRALNTLPSRLNLYRTSVAYQLPSDIQTKIIVLSDTHGEPLKRKVNTTADVAIHCGDLTDESKLDEFKATIEQLKAIGAPIKLVIAGNHDFTLDDNAYAYTRNEVKRTIDDAALTRTYGSIGEARVLFESEDAKSAGIVFLSEGTHKISLKNGALLTVYASPYTPSKSSGWGFQYDPQQGEHHWEIDSSVDLVMAHGPAHGVLDYTGSRQRAGSPSLFAAIAKAKPKMHCFGHIHESWGAKLVTWRPETSDEPSHFTDIDNDRSTLIESRATLHNGNFDDQELLDAKAAKRTTFYEQGYRDMNDSITANEQTLFVNAAIEGVEEDEQHLPWLVNVSLPVLEISKTDDAGTADEVAIRGVREAEKVGEPDSVLAASKKRRADAMAGEALAGGSCAENGRSAKRRAVLGWGHRSLRRRRRDALT
ncbi:uncharacterized protein LTR77_000628 [Saxophila tyrrhenica]|uniref:Calcineurin-like phosphoesterase domain-containing protein n=1 Tax=Saxophila tyrrhenica TaxID=1690608 RepID=A0AAV9PN72_9PEZI|nr:hypothetical protein LTR77_000628 [Saxophila tyrrhenica]